MEIAPAQLALKIVIITSSSNRFKPIVQFLIRRGITTTLATDAKAALSQIAADRPDFVLISWNFKGTPPVRLYELISKSFRVPCIGFAEEGDSRTAAGLAQTGPKEIIHAPVSGPVFFMRIQKIIKEREAALNETAPVGQTPKVTTQTINDSKMVAASPSAIEHESGEWAKREVRGEAGGGKTVWMFKREGEVETRGHYYFFGDHPPVKSGKGGWGLQPGELFFSEESEEALGLTAETSAAHAQGPKTVIAPQSSPAMKPPPPEWGPAEAPVVDRREVLREQLRKITERIVKKSVFEPGELKQTVETEQLGIVEIASDEVSGYLLLASIRHRAVSTKTLVSFREKLKDSILLYGRGLVTGTAFDVDVKTRDVGAWGQRTGEFCLCAKFETEDLCIFFLEKPAAGENLKAGLLRGKKEIPLDAIKPQERTGFDVFVDLPRNKKFLRYLKKNSVAHEERLENLRKNNVKAVFISPDQIADFRRYQASTFVRDAHRRFQSEFKADQSEVQVAAK